MFLKQSTAVVVSFGPFLDKTDGVALETGLVSALDHSSTGIMLSKNGGTLTVRNATVTATTYDSRGNYKVSLKTNDTDTAGTLRMQFDEAATCLPVWMDFMVLPAAVYDALTSTARFGVDFANFNTYPAGPFHPFGIVDSGTAQSATGTTLVLRAAAAFATSELIGSIVVIRSATAGAGQARMITANVGSTDTVTVDAWTTTPTGTILYDLFASAPGSVTSPPSVALTVAERQAVADALLARNAKGAADGPANQSVSAAIAGGFMRFDITGGVMTVLYPDGTTAFTRTLTRAVLDAVRTSVP